MGLGTPESAFPDIPLGVASDADRERYFSVSPSHNQRFFFREGIIGTMDGDDERPQGHVRWMNGMSGSIIGFAIGALFLAGGIYGFAEHSTPRVSQAVDWPDWLCTAGLIIGVIILGFFVMKP